MIIRYISCLLLFITFTSCSSQEKERVSKINGVSFVASRDVIDSTHIQPVVEVNANWAAVMPFAFMQSKDTSAIVFNIERQWWGEREEGAKKTIHLMKQRGIKVMVKPQIWIRRGEFTGNIAMQKEEEWLELEKNYKDFILLYAHLAEETGAELFCIGTELNGFVFSRPHFWKQLITEIKTVYKGKLTYAENWDAKRRVSFWDQLDYIGIDAYYPVSESKTPTVEEARLGWQKHKLEILDLHKQYNLPILFTEYGYRSRDFAGKTPWESERVEGEVNHLAQENLTKALFEEFWNEPWFAGGFHWKWFHDHERAGGLENNQFTVQNKPTETVVKKHYSTSY
ncbi:MAG: glycoside hydrolase [Flavobacteriaceae bacterium]|nr:glycoside hydrolase [Flavobacteriaceae bacterium]